ncbi:hypothetical protein GCM10010912_49930 [Paenibacillus albidus]|uniref:beta-fructofuranosidase n=1 Tax=Paenibacillus albidus TaxID=2041023 RepID=A0A917FT24_9BACL|nr:GH32 C-terminal domain-containing protein [Paenibacillus albidus]GGF99176.1 hypothetical protein GCM10010912_49930 [Paenibacillus albidus]
MPENKGLLKYWAFDEGAGDRVKENISGHSDEIYDVFKQPKFTDSRDPQWRRGVSGNCLLLDGYSTYIAHEDRQGDGENRPNSLSVGAWVAPRSYEWGDEGRLSAIVNCHDRENNRGYLLGMYRHGAWSFQIGLESGEWVELWSPDGYELRKNEWSCISAVFDSEQGMMKLYLNGDEIASLALPAGAKIAPSLDRKLLIGRNNESLRLAGAFQLHMFAGLIDELKLYGRALQAEEVAKAYRVICDNHGGKHPELAYDEIKLDRTPLLHDRHRPQYHVSPPAHWMNEPHAPVYFNRKYHLFYQHNPQGPFFHQIHWGHWVSEDLVNWRDLPVALAPEKDHLAPDGIWSGSASYDSSGQPVLFFTAGNNSVTPDQSVALARSTYLQDGDSDLVRWIKHPEPLIVQEQGLGLTRDFRDPFVWKEDNVWYALVGSGVEGAGGTALAYISTDMIHWTYKGHFYRADFGKYSFLGPIWELPVLLPLGRDAAGAEKHLFLISPVGQGADVEVFYWMGTLDREMLSFTPDQEEPQLIDVGDFHFTGPSGMVDPKTGRAIIFTIAQGERTPELEYASGWAHNGGLPLNVYLREDGRLGIEPIQELQSLRGEQLISITGKSLKETNGLLEQIRGDMLEIRLEMKIDHQGRSGIKVRVTPDGEEETLLYYHAGKSLLAADRTRTTLDPEERTRGIQGGTLELHGENLKLHIYLDRSMIEVYANGLKSLTTRAYPSRKDALGVTLWADGEAVVQSLEIWEMKPVWK